MTTTRSRIACDIDLDAPGKHLGALHLIHHGDNRHAFSAIPIPIAVIKGGDGPSVMLSGGNHGDEYEGQIALHALLRELEPRQVAGRLIILPSFNLPAVLDGARVSPLDGGNLNRAFPGDPEGGPTAMLAHYVASEIIPRCRYAVDLHSGGRFGRYLPCSYLHWGGDELHKRAKLEGARAFGAPNAVIATGAANRGSMTAECDRQGVVMISCELGGGAAIERETLELAQRGIRGVLAHWGVVARSETAPAREPRLLELAGGFAGGVMAEADGLFGPVAEIGDRVAARDLAGHIFPIGALARPAIEARFAAHGLVVSRRLSPLVKRGDYLYRLARETDRAALGLK